MVLKIRIPPAKFEEFKSHKSKQIQIFTPTSSTLTTSFRQRLSIQLRCDIHGVIDIAINFVAVTIDKITKICKLCEDIC